MVVRVKADLRDLIDRWLKEEMRSNEACEATIDDRISSHVTVTLRSITKSEFREDEFDLEIDTMNCLTDCGVIEVLKDLVKQFRGVES